MPRETKNSFPKPSPSEEQFERRSDEWNHEEQREKEDFVGVGAPGNRLFPRASKSDDLFGLDSTSKEEERERMIEELSQAAQDLQEKVSSFLKQAAEAEKTQAVWIPAGTGLKISRGKIPWPVSGTDYPVLRQVQEHPV